MSSQTTQSQNNTLALGVLTSLFFMMGFITCMNDILIPHLKKIFDLSYTQAMLVQFFYCLRVDVHSSRQIGRENWL